MVVSLMERTCEGHAYTGSNPVRPVSDQNSNKSFRVNRIYPCRGELCCVGSWWVMVGYGAVDSSYSK